MTSLALIERDRALRQIAEPAGNDDSKELLPGEIRVSPHGPGARIGTYEAIYWTGTLRFNPDTGVVEPDVIRSRYNGLTPGIVVEYNKRTNKWEHDNSAWLAAQQSYGHIRVDGILGDMPATCEWSGDAYSKYVAPLMTEEGLLKVKALGVTIHPRQHERLGAFPKDFRRRTMPTRGDLPDDIKRKKAVADRAANTIKAYKALLAKVFGSGQE